MKPRRRKQAGTYWTPQARADLISLLHAALAAEPPGSTLSGITVFTPGSEPVYLAAADAKRRPGSKADA